MYFDHKPTRQKKLFNDNYILTLPSITVYYLVINHL